jgi:hypothetical protein
MAKIVGKQKTRNIEFIGDHRNDSIVIGNYGDVKMVAKGNFNLSGLIYCSKSTVEFNIGGEGTLSFNGVCNKLIIRGMEGNCTLDLSNFTCKTVWCEYVKGNSVIILGNARTIELISLDQEAIVKYDGKPILLNYSLRGNSKIQAYRNVHEVAC